MTNTRRRVIKIRLSPRDAADSPALLQNVEAAFQHDDLDIDMREAATEPLEAVEVPVSQEAVKATGDALDLKDQMINQGMETVPTPVETEGRVRRWLTVLREQGIKVVAGAAVKAVLERMLDIL